MICARLSRFSSGWPWWTLLDRPIKFLAASIAALRGGMRPKDKTLSSRYHGIAFVAAIRRLAFCRSASDAAFISSGFPVPGLAYQGA